MGLLNLSLNFNLNLSLSLLPILLLATPSATPGLTPIHTSAALYTDTHTHTHARALFSLALLSSVLDACLEAFKLCLGMQTGLNPSALNQGEFPACAAMTTGYVFRVENQATVMYLQKVGRTGHLTTLDVHPPPSRAGPDDKTWSRRRASLLSSMPGLLLVAGLTLFPSQTDSPSVALVASLALLILSRILSVIALRARTSPAAGAWRGAPEPGVRGDLLVLLSEDRWVRIRGLVDDLKAVTSGAWLGRPQSPACAALVEGLDWVARMLVYLAVVALGGATDAEKGTLVGAVLAGHLLLVYQNSQVDELVMNGRTVAVAGTPDSVKNYARRLDMAKELVKEMGRSDFAVRLGLINPDKGGTEKKQTEKGMGPGQEVVTM
ncbi:uncharacterized protein PV07_10483 [Cladophialophora immunda]|uniref:Uncharacterized protein n=1 Tax=Cladophialophora immunda TaxID=569365 RepID=A0A0D2AIR1_9EURO|nr:uncharacterized protein PV07_10483 [Cladophialophora immunda]KIW24792.1 hypothetical protein PV07_10483 [Cladophialophora immunda]